MFFMFFYYGTLWNSSFSIVHYGNLWFICLFNYDILWNSCFRLMASFGTHQSIDPVSTFQINQNPKREIMVSRVSKICTIRYSSLWFVCYHTRLGSLKHANHNVLHIMASLWFSCRPYSCMDSLSQLCNHTSPHLTYLFINFFFFVWWSILVYQQNSSAC